jgi:hypothetical protein
MQFAEEKLIPATLIAGDGIGPEIVEATITVLDALNAPFAWETHKVGMSGLEAFGDPLPQTTLDSIQRTRLALKGPLTTPVGGGDWEWPLRLTSAWTRFFRDSARLGAGSCGKRGCQSDRRCSLQICTVCFCRFLVPNPMGSGDGGARSTA